MQQIFLLGSRSSRVSLLAERVMQTLPVRAVGFRMLPFTIAGRERGEVLHFLTATSDPLENDVPCILELGHSRMTEVPEVWEALASRVLRSCLPRRAPILLDRLTAAALSSPSFSKALSDCIHGEMPVLALAQETEEETLRACFPEPEHLWLQADMADAESLTERLQQELLMRL